MADTFPNDADGDALRRVAGDGSDLSRPMEVHFTIAVPDEGAGRAIGDAATKAGFTCAVERSEESGAWTSYCTKVMIASYDALIREQEDLQRLATPHHGDVDGWYTAGNVEV